MLERVIRAIDAAENQPSVTVGSMKWASVHSPMLAQSEVGVVALAESGSSSSLPHKSNPVTAELLVSLAHHNAVLVSALYHATVHEQERLGSAWTLRLTLPQMLRNAGGALRLANRLIETMRFN